MRKLIVLFILLGASPAFGQVPPIAVRDSSNTIFVRVPPNSTVKLGVELMAQRNVLTNACGAITVKFTPNNYEFIEINGNALFFDQMPLGLAPKCVNGSWNAPLPNPFYFTTPDKQAFILNQPPNTSIPTRNRTIRWKTLVTNSCGLFRFKADPSVNNFYVNEFRLFFGSDVSQTNNPPICRNGNLYLPEQ